MAASRRFPATLLTEHVAPVYFRPVSWVPQNGFATVCKGIYPAVGRPGRRSSPESSGITNAGQGGQLRKEGLAHKATRVPGGTLEFVIASASESR